MTLEPNTWLVLHRWKMAEVKKTDIDQENGLKKKKKKKTLGKHTQHNTAHKHQHTNYFLRSDRKV